MSFPSLQQAKQIWQEGFDYRCTTTDYKVKNEYVFHTQGVASAAQKIASATTDLDPEKAYILGLLHDYGKKYDERAVGIFHGRLGFEELNKLGYPAVAKVCLTHTFPRQNFEDKYYTSYPPQDLIWAHKELAKLTYDDYDRLIQLCDMFFEAMNMVDFETRFTAIVKRYNLTEEILDVLRTDSYSLKLYFEGKTGCDIYQLLNIKAL